MAPVIYDLTIGVYMRALKQLSVVLQKGEQWATENNALDKLVQSRLAPDMFQLPFQVHTACRISLATLDNATPPSVADGTDFASLQENIRLTLEKLEAIDPQSWTGKEDTEVFIQGRVESWDVEMIPFMQSFGLPNFWFHVVTAYAILRNQGVPVGKPDFLGPRKHIFKVHEEKA